MPLPRHSVLSYPIADDSIARVAATSKTTSKTASKKAAPSANSDAKVKKSTKKTDTGIKKAPSLYNTYCAFTYLSPSPPPKLCFGRLILSSSRVTVKANYALVKEENPELEPKEMMAKMGELVSATTPFSTSRAGNVSF